MVRCMGPYNPSKNPSNSAVSWNVDACTILPQPARGGRRPFGSARGRSAALRVGPRPSGRLAAVGGPSGRPRRSAALRVGSRAVGGPSGRLAEGRRPFGIFSSVSFSFLLIGLRVGSRRAAGRREPTRRAADCREPTQRPQADPKGRRPPASRPEGPPTAREPTRRRPGRPEGPPTLREPTRRTADRCEPN